MTKHGLNTMSFAAFSMRAIYSESASALTSSPPNNVDADIMSADEDSGSLSDDIDGAPIAECPISKHCTFLLSQAEYSMKAALRESLHEDAGGDKYGNVCSCYIPGHPGCPDVSAQHMNTMCEHLQRIQQMVAQTVDTRSHSTSTWQRRISEAEQRVSDWLFDSQVKARDMLPGGGKNPVVTLIIELTLSNKYIHGPWQWKIEYCDENKKTNAPSIYELCSLHPGHSATLCLTLRKYEVEVDGVQLKYARINLSHTLSESVLFAGLKINQLAIKFGTDEWPNGWSDVVTSIQESSPFYFHGTDTGHELAK